MTHPPSAPLHFVLGPSVPEGAAGRGNARIMNHVTGISRPYAEGRSRPHDMKPSREGPRDRVSGTGRDKSIKPD